MARLHKRSHRKRLSRRKFGRRVRKTLHKKRSHKKFLFFGKPPLHPITQMYNFDVNGDRVYGKPSFNVFHKAGLSVAKGLSRVGINGPKKIMLNRKIHGQYSLPLKHKMIKNTQGNLKQNGYNISAPFGGGHAGVGRNDYGIKSFVPYKY